jgi:hypothetical protein
MHHSIKASHQIRIIIVYSLLMIHFSALAQSADRDGITDLMRAARDGEERAFSSVIKKEKNINAQDAWGWTALTYAVVRGSESMTSALISRQADLNVLDEEGRSPLLHAINYDRDPIARLLIAHGANPNVRDISGITIIGLAWANAKDDIVDLLEKAGADKLRFEDKRADIYSPYKRKLLTRKLLSIPKVFQDLSFPLPQEKQKIIMRLLVRSDGTVKKVRVLRGLPMGLTERAIKNAYSWQYQVDDTNPSANDQWIPFEAERQTYP